MAKTDMPSKDRSIGRSSRDDSVAPDESGSKNADKRNGRGIDRIFLPAVVAVMLTAAWVANRPTEEQATLPVPDFSMPGIQLEMPFELPFAIVRFKDHEAQRLDLELRLGRMHERDGKGTERAIVEVREALLESSARDESDIETIVEHIAVR